MQKLHILATIVIFTLILAACADKPTDVVVSTTRVTSLTPTTAKYFDTVSIFGKNFGSKSDSITVFLDDRSISPLMKSDTCIKFVIPSSVAHGKKSVSVKFPKTEIKNFAMVEIAEPKWGDFVYAGLTSLLNCDFFYTYPFYKPDGRGSLKTILEIDPSKESQKFSGVNKDNNLIVESKCTIYDGNYSSNLHTHEFSDYTKKQEVTFHAEIDTSTKIVTNILVTSTIKEIRNEFPSTWWERNEGVRFKLRSATYQDIDNGIEIFIPFKNLEQSIEEVFHHDMRTSGNSTIYRLATPFENSNYIKIILLRKK
ncbi:MAG: IPT/TIG domain-containing protein [Ignavibacteria bacterium]|nr:IPT/TIG domain-containing protein [Ignavibacteria bacterium]